VKEQKANEEGQVEGGLASFISAELEDLEIFLKRIKEKKGEEKDQTQN
jgi:hypothetical protein